MGKKSLFLMWALVVSGFLGGLAQAALIVDTGQPSSSSGGHELIYPKGYAGEFSVSQTSTITDVQGWIAASQGGNLAVTIWTDGGDIPGSYLYSTTNYFPAGAANWVGPTGLSWQLTPGTYWVEFRAFGMALGLVGSMPYPAPSPLGNEAYSPAPASYTPDDGIDMGVRIYSNIVPLPGTAWLLGAGLVGLIGLRKKFRK